MGKIKKVILINSKDTHYENVGGTMQFIQSRQNKVIKEVISLKDKKNRRKSRKFLIEGYRFIYEAISSNAPIEKVIFSTDTDIKCQRRVIEKLGSKVNIYEVEPELFSQIAQTDTPQGVLCIVQVLEQALDTIYDNKFRGLVLDSIQDPGNAGTMIRTAHALGFNAVLATEGTVDIYNGKVLRATMGSIFYIPVLENIGIEDFFRFCEINSIRVIASQIENAKPCFNVDLTDSFCLVIGNEGNGISKCFQERATEFINIPMPGGAESFNAAVAASIMMYESNRQIYCIKC